MSTLYTNYWCRVWKCNDLTRKLLYYRLYPNIIRKKSLFHPIPFADIFQWVFFSWLKKSKSYVGFRIFFLPFRRVSVRALYETTGRFNVRAHKYRKCNYPLNKHARAALAANTHIHPHTWHTISVDLALYIKYPIEFVIMRLIENVADFLCQACHTQYSLSLSLSFLL